jgi:hypothetical protein
MHGTAISDTVSDCMRSHQVGAIARSAEWRSARPAALAAHCPWICPPAALRPALRLLSAGSGRWLHPRARHLAHDTRAPN